MRAELDDVEVALEDRASCRAAPRAARSAPLPGPCDRGVRRWVRNAFLISCWLIVEPPRASRRSRRSISRLRAICSMSKPWWSQNRPSSAETNAPRHARRQAAQLEPAPARPCRRVAAAVGERVVADAASVVTSAAGGSADDGAAVRELGRRASTPSPVGRGEIDRRAVRAPPNVPVSAMPSSGPRSSAGSEREEVHARRGASRRSSWPETGEPRRSQPLRSQSTAPSVIASVVDGDRSGRRSATRRAVRVDRDRRGGASAL